ncbi:hypothetical protein A2U01_0065899, partial [Trifolium medium]|nr:hypothetical protein [Trifolium medium]
SYPNQQGFTPHQGSFSYQQGCPDQSGRGEPGQRVAIPPIRINEGGGGRSTRRATARETNASRGRGRGNKGKQVQVEPEPEENEDSDE